MFQLWCLLLWLYVIQIYVIYKLHVIISTYALVSLLQHIGIFFFPLELILFKKKKIFVVEQFFLEFLLHFPRSFGLKHRERETVKEKEQEQKGVRELPLQLPVSTNDQLVSSYEKINQFLTTVLFLL